jgi:hypothetical protein
MVTVSAADVARWRGRLRCDHPVPASASRPTSPLCKLRRALHRGGSRGSIPLVVRATKPVPVTVVVAPVPAVRVTATPM